MAYRNRGEVRRATGAAVRWIAAALAVCALFPFATSLESRASEPDGGGAFFEREILPIFEANCFSCHGPGMQMSEFRLDRSADAMAGGKAGPSIVPGDAENSLLYRMVAGMEKDKLMPFGGDPLPPGEIEAIKRWIENGAEWAGADPAVNEDDYKHWSFKPVQKPDLPEVANQEWVGNPIDRFVLARLEKEGIEPSPRAAKIELLRRLHLDITGLPPTPDEINQFMQDDSPGAYETLVDRLLASPHYGERWGRHWLDLARYADSDGYEKDNPRPYAWRFRDWVIEAHNRDMPFDEFTVQQIAGDLLPDAGKEQWLATGFHRNTLTNTEGGVDQEEFRVLAVKDRVNTTSTVWLGLTVACAECHDHKFDPVSQEEYYEMFAFFNTAEEKNVKVPLPEEAKAYEKEKTKFDLVHGQLRRALDIYKDVQLEDQLREWEDSLKRADTRWTPLVPRHARSNGGTLAVSGDGTVSAEGDSPGTAVYTLTAEPSMEKITALRLEALPLEGGGSSGPGRASHGNFVLSEIRAHVRSLGADGSVYPLRFAKAAADYSQSQYDVAMAIDGDRGTGWAIGSRTGRAHSAVFELETPLELSAGAQLTVELDQNYGGQHTLGRFQLLASGADEVAFDGIPLAVGEILDTPPGERTRAQRRALLAYYEEEDPFLNRLKSTLAEHLKRKPDEPDSFVMAFEPSADPPSSHIMERGDFLRPGKEVFPGTPEVLPALEPRNGSPDRLDLARWLVSDRNPLTPRVDVNRVWEKLFGAGLTESVDDFGTRGEPPTHPALLDWLAATYRDDLNWSRKALIKLIVTSSTYRQSSKTRPELMDFDPRNRLLARQNRFRAQAEIVRDLALRAGGLLSPKIGGPSIRPPMPGDIAALGYAGTVKWKESEGEDKYRRGMYIFFQRTVPYPMLSTFDSPEGTVACTRRERSNTPLQALTVLNDPVFFECAQHLGLRIVTECGGGIEERIRHAFLLCLSREPSKEETAALARLYIANLNSLRDDPEASAAIAGGLEAEGIETAELAAWITAGRALMNVEEFFTRE